MRLAIQWFGVAVAGTVLGVACGSSDDRAMTPTEINRITPSDSVGAGGSEPMSGGGTAGIADFAGGGGVDDVARAGAGGEGGEAACKGNYECPAVIEWSYAIIKVDLPISGADAADAVFTACRNDDCVTAKGNAIASPDDSWARSQTGPVWLNFDESQASPFATLTWNFDYGGAAVDLEGSDHYSLTVTPAGADSATTLFDDDVQYSIVVVDQNADYEHYCSHCYEASGATVDARAAH